MRFYCYGVIVHNIETKPALMIYGVSYVVLYRVLSTIVKLELYMHFLSFIIVQYVSLSNVCMCFKKASVKCFI